MNLLELDHYYTKRFAFCASRNVKWWKLRLIFRVLEASYHGIPWLLISIILLIRSQSQSLSFQCVNLLVALFLDLAVVLIIKATVRRPRPAHHEATDSMITINVDNHFSFPSGHSTRAAMCCFLLLFRLELSPLSQLFIIVWSTATSVSRILLGRHYVSDVVAGVLIGFLQFLVCIEFLTFDKDACWYLTQSLQQYVMGKQLPLDPVEHRYS